MTWNSNVKAALLCFGLFAPVVVGARTWEVASDTTNAGQRLTNALANARNGDRIHVNAPGPYTAPPGGWRIKRSIELFGDGPGHDFTNSGSVLAAGNTSDPVLVLDVSTTPDNDGLQNLYIHDLQIRGLYVSAPNSNGIVFDNTADSTRLLANLRLARVTINDMGNDGFHLAAANIGKGAIVGLTMIDCVSNHNLGNGLHLLNATGPHIVRGYFGGNLKAGARISSCDEPQIATTAFEGNQNDPSAHPAYSPQLFFETAHAFLVQGCHFEDFNRAVAKTAITVVGGHGGYIGSSTFGNAAGAGSRGIYVYAGSPPSPSSSSSVVVGPNAWSNVDVLVELHDHALITSCVVEPQAVTSTHGVAAKLIVPETADRGHLVVTPTSNTSNLTAGVLFPRLSAATRDAMTAPSSGGTRRAGLLVYNDNTRRFGHWDGKRWVEDVAFFPADSTTANTPPGGINVPAVLTSATRDSIPSEFKREGALFFNATTGRFNYFDGTYWKEIIGSPSLAQDAP